MEKYNVVGVMSGTSLDGVDLAHVSFEIENGKWNFQILEAETVPYSKDWVQRLKEAVHWKSHDLEILNEEYTQLLASIIKQFLNKYELFKIDAVCSHGHTILHQPHNGLTLQIGNLPQIAPLIGQTVICDFRVQDVANGGQGAPLVPIGDQILFSEYDFCLNLGGFSNISFEDKGQRIAFDISPVNTVLNHYAQKLGFAYDDSGALAKSGVLHNELFDALNGLDFYSLDFPKSLGVEFVNSSILPLIEKFELSDSKIILRTFVEHIAFQICQILKNKKGKLLVTGGGAYNTFLIERIVALLPNIEVVLLDRKTIEFKEALIFALLGVLKMRNEINVLSSVTGAKEDHSSGKVYFLNKS
ncbi:anhydro-N-acetylmuramic acid kinase [Flavobacterium sp.]|uniref:anhydro-N-acetylmuramic acid kinase n=1 Tax=Flavobacterium sp. TaxID=239 RepID=UPI003D124823